MLADKIMQCKMLAEERAGKKSITRTHNNLTYTNFAVLETCSTDDGNGFDLCWYCIESAKYRYKCALMLLLLSSLYAQQLVAPIFAENTQPEYVYQHSYRLKRLNVHTHTYTKEYINGEQIAEAHIHAAVCIKLHTQLDIVVDFFQSVYMYVWYIRLRINIRGTNDI